MYSQAPICQHRIHRQGQYRQNKGSLGQLYVGDLVSQDEGDVGRQGVSGQEGQILVGEQDWVVHGLLEGGHEFGVDLGLCLLEYHLALYFGHLEAILLGLDHFLEFDLFDIEVGLSFNDLLALTSELLLDLNLLLLSSNEEVNLQFLHFLEVVLNALRDVGLGDPNREDLNARSPVQQVLVEGLDEFLVEFVEDVDIEVLQGVLGAELVDFVVEFIGDPELLVVLSIVQDRFVDVLLAQLVDHLDLVEVDEGTVGGAAGDVPDHVRLDAHLHLDVVLQEGDPEMEPRTAHSLLQHSQAFVYPHVPLPHLMESRQHRYEVRHHQQQNHSNH